MENKLEELITSIIEEKTANLSLDDLAGVAGGTHTQEEEALLRTALISAKQSGYTKEMVLSLIPLLYTIYHKDHPNVTKQEVVDYINQNWDSL